MRFQIRADERVVFLGMTGSGKSYCKKSFLDVYPRWIMYDLKAESRIPRLMKENPKDSQWTNLRDIADCKNPPHSIYVPETGSDEEFNELCRIILKRQNTLLDVDEIGTHSRESCPDFAKLQQMGRALYCPVWTGTQNPVWVDLNILRQAEHYFVFRLVMQEDRDRIKRIIGRDVGDLMKLPPHHFYYYKHGMEQAFLCKPVTRQI